MNVIVLIRGREAVPVRAIPLLTNWQVMSPDEIASALAHKENYENFSEMNAHSLENGVALPVATNWWERFACRDLKAITERIKATELNHEVGYQPWRDESHLVLPAGVFVWKDEFEVCYQKVYGPNGSNIWNTDAALIPKKERVLKKKERALKLALDFNPFIPRNRTTMVMEGFEPQQTALATPTPVGSDGAFGGVQADRAEPLPMQQGLSTFGIAQAFDGVNGWSFERWRKNLSASNWPHAARIAIGEQGGASSTWNPTILAQLMHGRTKGEREKEKLMKVLISRFISNPALKPWRDDFNEYFATYCAKD